MMGYQKGGDVKKKDKKTKVKKKKMNVPGKLGSKTVQERAAEAMSRMNNTSDAAAKTPAQAATPMPGGMGAAPKPMGGAKPAGAMAPPPVRTPPAPGAPGGMGAMMKPMGMKSGGKVKKKAKSYGHGGKVRGAGIAKKGVKKCKMR